MIDGFWTSGSKASRIKEHESTQKHCAHRYEVYGCWAQRDETDLYICLLCDGCKQRVDKWIAKYEIWSETDTVCCVCQPVLCG